MKKLTAILLTLALLLNLTACGDILSMLGQDKKDSSDTVQAKEPDIPGTPPSSGGDSAPVEPAEPDPSEPAEPQPDPDGAPAAGEEEEETPAGDIAASHTDVSLFSAGETFTMSAQGISGVYASSFVSENAEVASVDETSGVITAVAPGITTVTMHVECEAGQFDFDCIVRCRWSAEEPGLPGAGEDAAPETPSQPGDTPQTPAAPASLSDFFSTLQGQYEGLGMMMALDGELLENYYPGLSGIAAVEEVLIQETAITTANVAVGLVRLSDGASLDDILSVQAVFQSRINTQADGGAWYPASCETWKNGVITSVSNYVGMFVYPDGAHGMANLFTDTFSN